MQKDRFIQNLQDRLQKPLPGREAQGRMSTANRFKGYDPNNLPENHRKAAVLNLLHLENGVWKTVLMQRTENEHDRHSGQISFPGGSMEMSDGGDPAKTALREAEEEIGVDQQHITLLGAMTELYIPVSNFLVSPYVGVLMEKTEFVPQETEAVEVITPTLEAFLNPENRKRRDLRVRNFKLKNVPYFDIEGRMVWGATAMMMAEFMSILEEMAEWTQ